MMTSLRYWLAKVVGATVGKYWTHLQVSGFVPLASRILKSFNHRPVIQFNYIVPLFCVFSENQARINAPSLTRMCMNNTIMRLNVVCSVDTKRCVQTPVSSTDLVLPLHLRRHSGSTENDEIRQRVKTAESNLNDRHDFSCVHES